MCFRDNDINVTVYQNDYGHSPAYLRFSACQSMACADISILNDNITEYDESFGIVLERTPNLDSRISLSPESAVVTIMDDDGNQVCRLIVG